MVLRCASRGLGNRLLQRVSRPSGYNTSVLRYVAPAVLALAASLAAQTTLLPLNDVKPGMHGIGRTVFSGNRVEEFQVEILGVLDNTGPRQSLILARLSGGPLEHTGVMEGMSGSPVYIDGKLVGAVAMAFPFAKDPIAAIRPIEDMVRPVRVAGGARRAAVALADRDLTHVFARAEPAMAGQAELRDIATPLSFSGFSRNTLEAFAPQLRQLGFETRQGITSGARIEPGMGNPADIQPGSMISVQLLAGDYAVGADGTVTYIDGNRVYAFGHRFLDIGATALPFARAEVITLIPNTNTSFKISAAREWMGTIKMDGDTAISGELGIKPAMVPIEIGVSHAGSRINSFQMRMVDDPLLSPLLLQMAIYSVIDSTERTVGASCFKLTGQVEFQNAPAPVKLNNVFTADNGAAQQASVNSAIPIAYVMQSGFDLLKLRRVELQIEAFDRKKQLTIDSVFTSRHEVHPGETVRLNVLLTGENGSEITRVVDYPLPIGAPAGTLYFTVSDAGTANLADFRQILGATPHSAAQLISIVNNLHPNNKAYVRVWRTDPAYQVEGADLPALPASAALIMEGSQTSLGGVTQNRNSKIAELEIDGGDMVISGVKTIQVEVKP
jgi:hypothetical protein